MIDCWPPLGASSIVGRVRPSGRTRASSGWPAMTSPGCWLLQGREVVAQERGERSNHEYQPCGDDVAADAPQLVGAGLFAPRARSAVREASRDETRQALHVDREIGVWSKREGLSRAYTGDVFGQIVQLLGSYALGQHRHDGDAAIERRAHFATDPVVELIDARVTIRQLAAPTPADNHEAHARACQDAIDLQGELITVVNRLGIPKYRFGAEAGAQMLIDPVGYVSRIVPPI